MKVEIDRGGCIGCALCWTECPEVFEQDPDDSLSRIVAKYRISGDTGCGEAPEALREGVQSAADGCPVGVISLERG
ncbi:MAG TPA: ferredoxin [Rectinemataceae bacterium]|nr:ferredoxin [Rectinemataceae bacterium]